MIRPSSFHSLSPVAPATGKKVYASRKVQAGCVFLTGNTYKRVRLFRQLALCQVFFRELEFYRCRYRFRLYAYVLMPNHFHLLLDFPAGRSFADFLRDFKSAVSRLGIDWIKEKRQTALLARLRLARAPKRRKDPIYCLWQTNNYVRSITSTAMFRQKLDYIHANPVREGLVEKAVDYMYSSLRNYKLGAGVISIDPHDFLLD